MLFCFYYCCAGVLTIYHSWIHPLHHSPLSSFPYSCNSFNRSYFSIFIHDYIIFHHIHPPAPFPYALETVWRCLSFPGFSFRAYPWSLNDSLKVFSLNFGTLVLRTMPSNRKRIILIYNIDFLDKTEKGHVIRPCSSGCAFDSMANSVLLGIRVFSPWWVLRVHWVVLTEITIAILTLDWKLYFSIKRMLNVGKNFQKGL
jgi:hypothetical protein